MTRLFWIIIALLISGCATQNGGLSERDKLVLEGRIDDLESAQSRHKTKITSLEKRVAQLEEMLTLMSHRGSTEAREVVKISPDNTGISSQFNNTPIIQSENEVIEDIVVSEEKKRAYFGSPAYTSGNRGPSRAYDNVTDERLPTQNVPSTPPSTSDPASPMTFYQEGIDLYRQGQFETARARFEQFLATKPDESYIDNALYWIGDCFYGEGLYHEAANYFHKIVQDYPKANKVPDALLKVSLTYQKLGKLDSAREMLRYLMDAFPGTEAARIGKEKYESINSTP